MRAFDGATTENFGYVIDELTGPQVLALDDHFLRQLVYDHKLLVISGQPNTVEHTSALARKFGTLWTDEEYRLVQDQGMEQGTTLFSNTTDHKSRNADLPWHRDISWYRDIRYPLRALVPVACDDQTVPTNFADADYALQYLFDQEIEDLKDTEIQIQHLWSWNRETKTAGQGTKWIPLYEPHPITGRWHLMLDSFGPLNPNMRYSSRASASWIVGVRRRSTQADLGLWMLQRLHALALSSTRNVYSHKWKAGQFLIFDNHSGLLHQRPSIQQKDAVRTFRRVNIHHEGQTHVEV